MSNKITVIYSWVAKEGKLPALSGIYEEVIKQMEANEPGAMAAEFFVDNDNNSILVRDVFADASALGFHLTETAGKHFGGLLGIATPGVFYFAGQVPEELKQGIAEMGLKAHYLSQSSVFTRQAE